MLDNVTIALNNAVHVTNNNFLSAADIFTNKGTVYLDSIANATELLALGSVTLTGGGVLQLSDNSQNYIDGGTLTALTNVNNTIQGAGTIGFSGVKIVNQAGGTINATAATNRLVIYDPLTPVINAGLIEDTGPAGLLILNTAINNSSTIGALVAGSHVDLQSASITGGTLATANGGVIQAIDRGSVLDNVTIALNNGVHVVNNEFLTVADTFTNKGTVYLDSVGNATELLTLGSVTLTGGGVLQLSDNSQNYIDGGTLTTLTNVNNTIRGAGTIGFSGMKIVNQIGGTINATATTNRLVIYDPATPVANAGLIEDTGPAGLLILNTTIDNTSTIGALVAGSHVDLQSAVINGGVLAMANGGVIDAVDRGSVLNNVSVSVGTGSALVVNNNQYLYLGGTLTNQGTVALNSLGNDTELRTIGTVTLNGGGVLALSDNGQNYLTSNGTAAVLINQNNTILGGGQIGDGGDALFALTNTATGLINATASNALRISMGGGTLTNNGLIESTSTAVNNGGLLVFNTVIDNTGNANGGVIRSNGVNSHVNLQSATIKGGTFQAINGGIIQEIDRGSTIDSVTVAAGSAIHVVNNTYLFVANTLTNLGTVFLDSQGNDTELLATGTVTLTGGGLLTLSDNSQNYLNGSGATLLNVNNTIAGSGTIFGGLIFTNQSAGIVNATGAANRLVIGNTVPVTNAGLLEDTGAAGLGLVNTTVNNTGTIGAFGAGSHVDLQSATINGGILAAMGGGVIQELDRGSVLNGVTVAAGATVNTVNNAFLYLQGTITNRGTIGVNSGGNDTELVSSGSVTLTGGGTVLLSDTGQNYLSSTASATLINANNTIAGAGTIGLNGLTFTNQAAGTINGTGTSRLVIADTVPVTNAGLIEATGAGGIGIFSATVNNTGTIEALLAGTHVDLASATINGGVLATSSTGVIQAIDRGVTLNSVTIAAGSLVNVTNNNFMFLQGTISNLGTIGLSSGGNDTRLRLVGSVVIGGGGTIALSNISVNFIDSAVANTTLNLTAGTLQGTGTLGDANMTVVTGSAGTIVGSGLTVTTGANTLSNSGLLESLSGGLTVNETVANNGSIWANGGGLYIAGNITGTGAERITGAQTLRIGGSVASGQTVTFDSGSTGVLRLDNSQNFAGTVVGLANAANLSALDLSDIGFISGTTKATYAGTTAGGTLSVTDGTHTAKILLTGNYTAGSFLTSSDGHSGTTVVDPPGPAIAGLLGPSGALSPMDFMPAASVAAPMPAAGTSSTGGATDPMAPMMIPPIGAHGGGAIG